MIPSHCEYNLLAANLSIRQDRSGVGDRVCQAGWGASRQSGLGSTAGRRQNRKKGCGSVLMS